MFEPIKFPSILERLEDILASLSGRLKWTKAEATIESDLSVQSGIVIGGFQESRFATTYIVLSYEVDEVTFTKAFRLIAGHQDLISPNKTHKTIYVRYDPLHPERAYFAPACELASRFLTGAIVMSALIAIAITAVHNNVFN